MIHYGDTYTILISEYESEWGFRLGTCDGRIVRGGLYLARGINTEPYKGINTEFAALVKPILRKALLDAQDPSVSPNARITERA